MTYKFNVGNKVFLNSGSPEMTVDGYEKQDSPIVTVHWKDSNGETQEDTFHQDMLSLTPRK